MEKAISTINKENLVSNSSLLGVIALTAYTVKTNMEVMKRLNNIEEEMNNIKANFNDNNKRANIALTRLNQKIEDTSSSLRHQHDYLKSMREENKIVEERVPYKEENKDDISSALELLMKNK